jgi:hypothetical protein
MRAPRAFVLGIAAAGLCLASSVGWSRLDVGWDYLMLQLRGPYSIEERLAQFGARARERLRPHFAAAGVAFPPESVALLAFKDARRLELYARGPRQGWTPIRSYPVLAASGVLGPKLREGDKQVPEGLYRITLLNPNSRFHVSLRLDYPNAFDQRMARSEGRARLGGDIMIHGKEVSSGCLAMGDEAAEELFTLAATVMPRPVLAVISPTDFRTVQAAAVAVGSTGWTDDLYEAIRVELANFPLEARALTAVAR